MKKLYLACIACFLLLAQAQEIDEKAKLEYEFCVENYCYVSLFTDLDIELYPDYQDFIECQSAECEEIVDLETSFSRNELTNCYTECEDVLRHPAFKQIIACRKECVSYLCVLDPSCDLDLSEFGNEQEDDKEEEEQSKVQFKSLEFREGDVSYENEYEGLGTGVVAVIVVIFVVAFIIFMFYQFFYHERRKKNKKSRTSPAEPEKFEDRKFQNLAARNVKIDAIDSNKSSQRNNEFPTEDGVKEEKKEPGIVALNLQESVPYDPKKHFAPIKEEAQQKDDYQQEVVESAKALKEEEKQEEQLSVKEAQNWIKQDSQQQNNLIQQKQEEKQEPQYVFQDFDMKDNEEN